MRKSDAAFVTARKAASPAGARDDMPAKLVCIALALALLALAARIVSIW
jgi:hypothetical protein